jgi:transcriptional regulator with XRE-family HTH domain
MTNKEKFLALVSKEDTKTLADVKLRIKNRAMLRESQKIAIKVLIKLDELKWSQKDLATAMGIKPQQVTRILSGKENLTIDTQIKLQNILNIPVLASFYENKMEAIEESILKIEKRVEKIVAQSEITSSNYQASKLVKIERHDYTHSKMTG